MHLREKSELLFREKKAWISEKQIGCDCQLNYALGPQSHIKD